MTEGQIEDEVSKILNTAETMKAYGILSAIEYAVIRTKTKAWAYDRLKELQT